MSWTAPFKVVLTGRIGANYGFTVDNFKTGKEKGVFVNEIYQNAIQFPAGVDDVYRLKKGDKIIAVNDQPLNTKDIVGAVRQIQGSKAPAIFTIQRLSAAKQIPTTPAMASCIQLANKEQQMAPPPYYGHDGNGGMMQVSEGVFYV